MPARLRLCDLLGFTGERTVWQSLTLSPVRLCTHCGHWPADANSIDELDMTCDEVAGYMQVRVNPTRDVGVRCAGALQHTSGPIL